MALRSGGDPVLYINNPDGVPAEVRRRMLDGLRELNQIAATQQIGDPETQARIAQYEMAFRMQSSVPELTDLSQGARDHLQALRRGRAQAAAPSPTAA